MFVGQDGESTLSPRSQVRIRCVTLDLAKIALYDPSRLIQSSGATRPHPTLTYLRSGMRRRALRRADAPQRRCLAERPLESGHALGVSPTTNDALRFCAHVAPQIGVGNDLCQVIGQPSDITSRKDKSILTVVDQNARRPEEIR